MRARQDVEFSLRVTLDDLAAEVVQKCNHDAIIDFVKALDKGCADWDVTRRLHAYFSTEMIMGKEELEDGG